jgi:Protein of unknown function (DUF1569)
MSDVHEELAGTRAAVDEMIAATERCASIWLTPSAPGKWSPSQVVEHVARALEESANVAAGAPTKFPSFPFFFRPLIRMMFFNRVLKNNAFPKGKTAKSLDPESGPPTPAQARTRLQGAFEKFDRECREVGRTGRKVKSGIFGSVSPEDFVRFQGIHIRHHRQQMHC